MKSVDQISTKDRIVQTALLGLRTSGLAGASINKVIACSGTPRGSLYHHFPQGKFEIVREALLCFGEQRRVDFQIGLSGEHSSEQKILHLFRHMAMGMEKENFALGCAIASVALELDSNSDCLRPILVQELHSWTLAISRLLVPGQQDVGLAKYILATLQGALIQSRIDRNPMALLNSGEQLALSVHALRK